MATAKRVARVDSRSSWVEAINRIVDRDLGNSGDYLVWRYDGPEYTLDLDNPSGNHLSAGSGKLLVQDSAVSVGALLDLRAGNELRLQNASNSNSVNLKHSGTNDILKSDDSLWLAGGLGVGVTAPSAGIDSADRITVSKASNVGVTSVFENTSSINTGAHSIVKISTGGNAGGDAILWLSIGSATDWVLGVDNSDSDALVIARSTALGTSNLLRATGSGLRLDGGLSLGVAAPSEGIYCKLAGTGTGLLLDFGSYTGFAVYGAGVAANTVVGGGSVLTNTTDGFLYLTSCGGTPTGTPTTYAGRVPILVDTTGRRLYVHDGSAWRSSYLQTNANLSSGSPNIWESYRGTLANSATLGLGGNRGMVVLHDETGTGMALLLVLGGGNGSRTMTGSDAIVANTDTGSAFALYHNGSEYVLKNRFGSSRAYRVERLDMGS